MTTDAGESADRSIWHDLTPSGPRLPRLLGDTETDVAVVGLGGSGLSAVVELARRGVDVVGLDAGEVAGEAAGRNGGLLLAGLAQFHHEACRSIGRERALECYRLTLRELDRVLTETPEAAVRCGSLRIAADEAELVDCETQYRAMRADSLEVAQYQGPEGRGLQFPLDGAMNPVARCRALARLALGYGARLFEHSPVARVAPGRVEMRHVVVHCRKVLVCVDGRLELVVPELAGEVRSARLQMLSTEPLREVLWPSPVYRRRGIDYWQQLASGELVVGGCRDLGGEAEWTTESGCTEIVQRGLERRVRVDLGLPAQFTRRWSGIVGYAVTALPVVREIAPGVYVAGGYNGTGNLVGAIAARALVELALGDDARTAAMLGGL